MVRNESSECLSIDTRYTPHMRGFESGTCNSSTSSRKVFCVLMCTHSLLS
jgi:hypothetical protein